MRSPLNHDATRRLAGSTLVVGFDGTTPSDGLLRRLRAGEIAGVVLFRRNVGSLRDLLALTTALSQACAPGPVIAVDQEGGRVARLREGVVQLPAMRRLGDHDDPTLTFDAARTLGLELSALGINLDFAPVCDVDSNPANPVIGDRSFGATAERVERHASAFVRGLQSAGVAACAKHFPGHGDTDADSHLELPRLRHELERLLRVELPPFQTAIAAGVATVMTAHVAFDALDPERPATLSASLIDGLLRSRCAPTRDDLVVVSDDLLMRAVSARWEPERAAILAIEAGCDMLLVCDDEAAQGRCLDALSARALECGRFAERLRQAAARVDALRLRWPSRPAVDLSALGSQELHERLLAPLGVGASRATRDPTERR